LIKNIPPNRCLSGGGAGMEGGMLYDIDCSPMSVNGDVGRVELESFEIFCSRIPENRVIFFGSLSEDEGYTVFDVDLRPAGSRK
jgi:hypothetical protein